MAQTFSEFLQGLTLNQFVDYFGYFRNPSTGAKDKFVPWPKQRDFMDWLDNLKDVGWLLKSRQAGGSTISAFKALKTAIETPNVQVIVLSKDEDAATYFLGKRVMDAFESLPDIQGIQWPTITKQTQQHIEFSNGSKISSSPATAIGAAGVTAKLVIFDEVALVDLNAAARGGAREVFSTVRPVVQKAGGVILMLSTARPASFFNEMCQAILTKEKDMPLFFFSATDDPTLTPEVFAKLKSEYGEIEFRREYPINPEDAFLANTGLVFKSFSEKEHVKPINVPNFCDTYLVLDQGFRHPTVATVFRYNYRTDVLYIDKELIWKEIPVEQIARDLRQFKSKLPDNTQYIADAAIFARTGHMESIADIYARVGIRFRGSYKHKGNDPYEGSVAKVGYRFATNKIFINPSCSNMIWELRNWRWKDKGTRDMPQDTGDDSIDTLKYVVAEIDIREHKAEPKPLEPYSLKKMGVYGALGARGKGRGGGGGSSWQGT